MANSTNNGGMFDPYGLNEMLAQYLSNLQGQQPSLANNDFTRETKEEVEKSVKDVKKMTEDEIKRSIKQLESLFTSVFGRSSNARKFFEQFEGQMVQLSKQMSVSTTLFSNLSTSAGSLLMQLSRAGNLGFFNLNKKGIEKNLPAQQIMAALLPGMEKKLDSVTDKLLAFFQSDSEKKKVQQKQFGEDLIEGLARSKFVGGAITDLIRLVTLFAGSWLKNFGPLGKALAVGLVALGPVIGAAIANILVKSLTSAITNVFKVGMLGLGTLLKATIMSFTNRALLTSTLQGAPTIARGSITGGNLAVGSFLAAGALGVSAANTWKQDGTRNKWAGGIMGLGSAAFGTAGIASLLAPLFPLLAPVAPIALAVGAIAAGIGLIVKFWPQITDFFKSILSFLGIIVDKDKNGGYSGGAPSFFENINKDFSGQKGTVLKSKTKYHPQLSENELAAWKKADETKASVNELGAITNFGQMTQQQAGREMERLRKENPTAWNKLYEYIPFEGVNGRIYGKKENFGTDLISPDGKGFYMAKGSMERMDKANAFLESQGYKGSLQFSGGIATAGNIQELQASPHKLTGKGHDSPYGAKFDIGQSSISQVINAQGAKASYSLIDKAIKTGWENAKIRSEGDHRDVLWVPGTIRTAVRESKENKVQSSSKSIKPNVPIEEEGKQPSKTEKETVKPQTVAEKHQDNILFNNSATRAMDRFVKSRIDYTGSEGAESAVLKKGVWMMNYSPEQH